MPKPLTVYSFRCQVIKIFQAQRKTSMTSFTLINVKCHFYAPKELWEAYSNHTVRPSVCPSLPSASCLVHISHILWDKSPKFGVCMHFGMAECRVSFSGHCDLDLWPTFLEYSRLEHISYIIWGRNPKFSVCMHIGIAKCRVPSVTLTSYLVSRILYSLR